MWFSVMWVPKLLLPPVKIRILAQNWHFGHFGSNFFDPIGAMPTYATMRMRCLGGFLICGYQKFCFLPEQ